MISFGLAMAVYTAQNFGARKFARISRGVKKCSLLSIGFSVFAAVLMYFFGQEMIGVFLDNPSPKVMDEAKLYLHLSVPFYLFKPDFYLQKLRAGHGHCHDTDDFGHCGAGAAHSGRAVFNR